LAGELQVRDVTSGSTDWGTITVEHYYVPDFWISQYGHGNYPAYWSVGQAVSKGAALGNMDRVGTASCHLHHEIREIDHSNPYDASNYPNTPQKTVGDWYQDPLSFISAHRSYKWVRWVDEGAFVTQGTWTRVTDVGDRDDLIWASTAATSTRSAQYTFTPPALGQYELWAFIPWNYATSNRTPVRLMKSGSSTAVMSKNVDQGAESDTWIRIGSTSLDPTKKYTIVVSNNTGETGKRVAVDDFLIIRTQ